MNRTVMIPTSRLIGAAILACGAGAAGAVALPDDGFEWATITHPGNGDFDRPELWDQRLTHGGNVDHIYRIATTKVTNEQWLAFVHAYAPHHDGPLDDPDMLGWDIRYEGTGSDGLPRYSVAPSKAQHAATASWFIAARYCNWLHNDLGTARADFYEGAYDTRDAVLFEDRLTDELYGREPGARFWIPSDDEWVKAMYWDPDHPDFPGGGYWYYPHGKDVPPVSDLPENGGETNAGDAMNAMIPFLERDPYLRVGLYAGVTSPWGLLDGSGNGREWTDFDNSLVDSFLALTGVRGTAGFQGVHDYYDSVDSQVGSAIKARNSVRIASIPLCNADLAIPFGVFDLADIISFVHAYLDQSSAADLAPPFGAWTVEDLAVFLEAFLVRRCGNE